MVILHACRAGTKGEPTPMSVGRNELCSCGSGKKFKKCCGVVTSIAQIRSVREQKLRKEYALWVERLNKFVANHISEEEVNLAREKFSQETGIPLQDCFLPEWTTHFLNWLVFDGQQHGTSLLDKFISQDGRRMDVETKKAFRNLYLHVYEIVKTEDEVLTVRQLDSGHEFHVVGFTANDIHPGQIIVGRFLSLGMRQLLFAGSLVLQPTVTEPFMTRLQELDGSETRADRTSKIYRYVVKNGLAPSPEEQPSERFLQRVYDVPAMQEVRKVLETNTSFELKKRDSQQEVWVYAARKEEYLFKALDHTLLELHEVSGELILQSDKLIVEGFAFGFSYIENSLQLSEPTAEKIVDRLTSTGKKLTKGTIFITSQPMLPPKVLQWAVQTYFAEKWLVTPHHELTGLAPILVAASDNAELRADLVQLVEKLEKESELGQGMARFMRLDMIRPGLSLTNSTLAIANLLKRPLIEGLPESVFTVQPARLEEITGFVKEMTEGKSDATMKKYDEAMNLFRSFIRCAFGPSFGWSSLRREEIVYFLTHDVLERVDSPSKTLASNLLSVLSTFFKWLDKNGAKQHVDQMNPLLTTFKEDLQESYRLRQTLQKEASYNLKNSGAELQTLLESQFIIRKKLDNGWLVETPAGEDLIWNLEVESNLSVAPDWIISGLFGQAENGQWRLCGTPELYPPAVGHLLGAKLAVLV